MEFNYNFLKDKANLFIASHIMPLLYYTALTLFFIVVAMQWKFEYGNFLLGSLQIPTAPITSDKTISLSGQPQLITVSLSGTAKLNADDGLVRVILTDNQGNEYLVYESNNSTDDIDAKIPLNNACEETCQFGPITPASLKIKITDGSLKITSLTLQNASNTNNVSSPGTFSQLIANSAVLKSVKNKKLQQVQAAVTKKHLTWTAGETWVSDLTYAQKKKLFTNPDGTPVADLPNLQGFEYYKGGIFKIASSSQQPAAAATPTTSSGLSSSWDWRNVMDQNWNTSVKNQGSAGTCWAFAEMAAFESQINLNYGQHIDVDLSEQQAVDCANEGEIKELSPMNPENLSKCYNKNYCYPDSTGFCRMESYGAVDESCDLYAQRNITYNPSVCDLNHVCVDYASRGWKLTDFHVYDFSNYPLASGCPRETGNLTIDDVKKILVLKGPVNSGLRNLSHAMELEGYIGNRDWKLIDACLTNICTDTGCISASCATNGEVKRFCAEDSGLNTRSLIETLTCVSNKWVATADYCGNGQTCYEKSVEDPRCVDSASLSIPIGYKACKASGDQITGPGKSYSLVNNFYYEYSPGKGDTNWIFKNSWGTDWGDNGYATVATYIDDLGWLDLPIPPFTPPTDHAYWPAGFTNSPSLWFYKQTCNSPGISPNYTAKMGFANGQQTTLNLSCPTGQVCQLADASGFVSCTCTPNWSCGAWSACINLQQTRTCADSNNCGVTTGQPSLTQSCKVFCADSDEGLDYYIKGTLTTNAPQWVSPSYDFCQTKASNGVYQNIVSCSGNNCYIHEYSCNGSVPVNNAPVKCLEGCKDGACDKTFTSFDAKYVADIATATKLCMEKTAGAFPVVESFGLPYAAAASWTGSINVKYWDTSNNQWVTKKSHAYMNGDPCQHPPIIRTLTCRAANPGEVSRLDFSNTATISYQELHSGGVLPVLPRGTEFINSMETSIKICQLKGYSDAVNFRPASWCNAGNWEFSWNKTSWQKLGWAVGSNSYGHLDYGIICRGNCAPHAFQKCVGNSVYWFNSCDTQEEKIADCSANQTCQDGQCANITCSSNIDCGTNGYVGSPFCQSGDVYQNYKTYTCNNPGTASSSCTNNTVPQLKTDCTANQTCSNGSCTAIACSSNIDCGTNAYEGSPFCQGNSVYKNFRTWTCDNPGTANSSCSSSVSPQKLNDCASNQTCQNGSCSNVNIQNSSNDSSMIQPGIKANLFASMFSAISKILGQIKELLKK